jgi:putative ABC transport system permease protein
MFKNYLMVAFRNLKRQKGYSLINILGLAIGMALCLLILVYVQDELSYDGFHEKADRIFRIAQVENHDGQILHYMRIGAGIKSRLETDFPEAIEKSVRLFPVGEVWTKFDDKLYREDRFYVADETFFDIFSFEFLDGNPETALQEPNSIVLNRTTAEKYFGNTNCLGKMVRVDMPGAPLIEVKGIVEDMPVNSHFHPDALVSFSTIVNEQNEQFFNQVFGNTVWSYILLKEDYSIANLESRLPEFLDKHLDENLKDRLKELYLQPLKDIHLRSSTDPFTEIEPENTGNITYLYIFSAVAFLVLLVACINFMNLATARSARRAREVGMRKVVGAGKRQLIRQFIGESMFIAVLALPVAISLAHLFLPVFNSLAGKEMGISYFSNLVLLPVLLVIVLFVGFIAGSYPAFFLSAFHPIDVLKGQLRAGGGVFRKILVTGQFAVSIGFVIGILVFLQQLNFMRNTDLGFNKNNVLVIPVLIPEPPQQRMSKMQVLRNEFMNHPRITEVALSSSVPSEIRPIVNCREDGASESEAKIVAQVAVDYEYLKTLHIELLDGRDFSRDYSTDVNQAFIVNEAVVRELGLESPLGTPLILGDRRGTIIGVMTSMHWEPKRRFVAPMVFYLLPQGFTKIAVRVSPEDIPGTLAFLEEKWKEQITTRPFQYEFLEDMVDNLYRSEKRMSDVVFSITVLSLFVACMGLFGLASYTTEQKTKEIGIRKVLGSSVTGVVFLLSKQFGKLILIANVIAWPLAYYALHRWLQNFYYRISIGLQFFVLSAVLVLVIAFVSISYQSTRAALANPADALRYE